MANEETTLEKMIAALLAINVDQYLRDTGIARPKPRSIDRMLNDVGLSARDIAALLGKTERAVHLQLAGENKKNKSANTETKQGA
jgi:hypothetical protein